MHPDDVKKKGIETFKQRGTKIEIIEMNLDEKQLQESKAKKEEILRQQQSSVVEEIKQIPQKEEGKSEEPVAKKKDKKKKKKKNKGLADFMEDDGEKKDFEAETGVKVVEEAPQQQQ